MHSSLLLVTLVLISVPYVGTAVVDLSKSLQIFLFLLRDIFQRGSRVPLCTTLGLIVKSAHVLQYFLARLTEFINLWVFPPNSCPFLEGREVVVGLLGLSKTGMANISFIFFYFLHFGVKFKSIIFPSCRHDIFLADLLPTYNQFFISTKAFIFIYVLLIVKNLHIFNEHNFVNLDKYIYLWNILNNQSDRHTNHLLKSPCVPSVYVCVCVCVCVHVLRILNSRFTLLTSFESIVQYYYIQYTRALCYTTDL